MARTKGATSNVHVSLQELMRKLNPDTPIPVARVWATALGLTNALQISTVAETPSTEDKIEFSIS